MADAQTATILVTDVVGSTEARVRLGEEGADALRRTHDELLRTAITDAHGEVIKGLGDGILAMFDSASDAVTAAVAIQQGAYAHNRHAPDQPLDIRVGVSAGDVTVEEGDCFGTPVVEASRLCAAAVGGQILAAELVRLLARGRGGHVFTAAGERELKGLPEPVPVVTVGWEPPELGPTSIPFPAGLVPHAALPFSGRDPQLESVVEAWKHAAAGERRVVLLSGEPGIGKTRLASEVARHAHDLGAVVLFGRCDEDMGVPFQPFVDALEHVVQSGPSVEQLGRHAGELVRLVPDVARVGGGGDLEPPLQSDPETERYRLFDAVAAWLGAVSNGHGVLLVLDDLHWAEKPTLLLLRHLIRSPEPMRLLVIGTYRDTDLDRTHPLSEVLADLRREPAVERLALSGLDVDGITELLAAASGERMDVRATELAQLLWSETEGNPFFVQEILRNLVESGRIVQRDGVWTTDMEVEELGIPEGVREIIGRRLSRLSEEANTVLATASVVGAVADVDILVAVCGLDEERVFDALDEATAASLLRETGSGAYEFTHALVRSTLYEEISAARRARRHRQVAEALVTRPDADVAALAYHFGRAGTVDARAVEFAKAAGERAMAQLAFDQAAAFFAQGLEAADDIDAGDGMRCELLIGLGTAQRLAAIPGARDSVLEAARLAQGLGDADLLARAALAGHRGFWSITGQVDEERKQVLKAALDAVGPEDSVVRVRLLTALAQELYWSDTYELRMAIIDEAVAMARRLGDDAALLVPLAARQLLCRVADRVPGLVADLPEVLALAERVGDLQTTLLVSAWGFMNTLELGDVAQADRLLDHVDRLAVESNVPLYRWCYAAWHCCRVMVTGTGDDIEAAATAAFQLGQESGEPDLFVWFGPQLFNARLAQGRIGEVLDLTRQEVVNNPGLPVWHAALAVALVHAGEVDEARAIVDRLMADGTDPFPYDLVWLMAHALLGHAVAAVGTPEQAAREYEILAPYADRIPCVGNITWHCTELDLALLAARLDRRADAERHFAAADAAHVRLDAPVWLARTRLEWGRFLLAGDGASSERARSLLTEARDLAARTGSAAIQAAADALLA